MRAITFDNSGGDNPTGGARTITWTLGRRRRHRQWRRRHDDGEQFGQRRRGQRRTGGRRSHRQRSTRTAPTRSRAPISASPTSTATPCSAVKITTLPTAGTIFLDTDGAGGAAPVAVTLGQSVLASEIAAGHLTYVPAANANGSPYATFTFQVQDNGGTLNGGVDLDAVAPNTFTFNVASVNDAPSTTLLQGDIATWTEGDGAVLLDVGSNLTVADIDSANFDGGTLTVTLTGGVVAQDGLFISAVGGVTSTANTVSVGGTQIGTYVGGGFGGGNIVFTFDPDATPAAVQALMRAISYNNNGGISPTAGARSVTWTLVDGDGTANGGSDTAIVGSTVNVVSINDAPAGTDNAFLINEDCDLHLRDQQFRLQRRERRHPAVGEDQHVADQRHDLLRCGRRRRRRSGRGDRRPVDPRFGDRARQADLRAGA